MSIRNPDAEAALEELTIGLLADLGWDEWANCQPETAADCHVTGRQSRTQVVLPGRLRQALRRLNPELPEAGLTLALEELTRDRSTMLLPQANRHIYDLLKDGVKVTYRNEAGEQRVDTVRVINWNEPGDNDTFLAQQMWIAGDPYTRRPDLVGFVNGLPLLLFELKKHANKVKEAYEGNLSDYKDAIPQLFWYNQLIVLSNGSDARLGTLTTPWRHFAQWKKIDDEAEPGKVALETMLRATCPPPRLLDLVENFILFQEARGGLHKFVAKNHQYLGVNNAIEAVQSLQENRGRLGVFWHTQGSGKSLAMIFFAQKVLRKIPGNWTFVVVTDRRDLDDQIYKTFASVGAVTEPETQVRAQDGEHLKQLLQEDHRYAFTLIHKFHTDPGQVYPVLSEREDVVVMTDEAHRTQYDILAQNMRNALPNAAFLGFTGTPLMAGEEKTKEVFGDYVSTYNFKQSVDDEATVPLFYENRIPELQLVNEDFDEEMERLLEEAALDEAQERKLRFRFRNQYHIITNDDRLEKIAADVVQHFLGRGFLGKAMVVSIDKLTVVRMYEKVRGHWNRHLAVLQADLEEAQDDVRRAHLQDQIRFMKETDMAVVISEGQNEVAKFREKGLDIVPHRKRMKNEDLDEKFKDPQDPFRLVFVCAMWMTGFDVPSCSTVYLDKPMRNHTLMQTIARANRVFQDKNNGLIVDYVGVFRDLQKALAIYATSGGGIEEDERPIKPKTALVEELREALDEAGDFCAGLGIDVQQIAAGEDLQRIALFDEAMEAVLVNDDTRRRFLDHANAVDRLFRAILPDERANEFHAEQAVFKTLAAKLRAAEPHVDVSGVMDQVQDLLDRSVAAEPFVIREATETFDLNKIDFEALREQFRTGRKRTQANKLRGALNSKVQQMVRLNERRMDYLQALQEMIEAYNAGRDNVDVFFEKLLALAQDLNEEEQRAVRENLNEEELALFDILLKPRPDLTPAEIDQVKEAARELLQTLKGEKLVLDWRKQQRTRAAVQVAVEKVLDDTLPSAYDVDWYERKCEAVYDHVYEKYYGDGRSVYSQVV